MYIYRCCVHLGEGWRPDQLGVSLSFCWEPKPLPMGRIKSLSSPMVALFWEFIFGPTFPQKFTSSHQYHFTFFFFFFFSPQTFYFSLLRGGTSPNWIYMLGDYPLFTISKNIYINYIKIDLTRNIWNHIGTDFNTIQSWKLSNQSQQVARNPSGLPRLSTAPDRQWCAIGSAPQS